MLNKIKPAQRSICQESSENLSSEGLRTLVIAQKILTEESYVAFKQKIENAQAIIDSSRDRKIQEAINGLEVDMEYLAVTGVEDKLQVEVL